jgi:hypothetical protein
MKTRFYVVDGGPVEPLLMQREVFKVLCSEKGLKPLGTIECEEPTVQDRITLSFRRGVSARCKIETFNANGIDVKGGARTEEEKETRALLQSIGDIIECTMKSLLQSTWRIKLIVMTDAAPLGPQEDHRCTDAIRVCQEVEYCRKLIPQSHIAVIVDAMRAIYYCKCNYEAWSTLNYIMHY